MSLLTVQICKWRSCSERYPDYIAKRLEADKAFYTYGDDVIVEDCFCQGRCKEGPTVVFDNDVQVWQNPVKASDTLRKKVEEARRKLKVK